MFHDDSDFGDLEYTPRTVKPEQANVGLALEKTAHLDDATAARVRGVSEIHKALFQGKQGIANVGEHCIKLFEGAAAKRGHPYKIHEALKGEVCKQIEEPLELGLI
ncbi:hypothetical protein HPB48_027141 [Haemaphysalis longicornis]|uniref:Uncharacterized protein n=1 Tax=Haemaphysalis longicornis TaxID=44386 RepID=A0A9J6HE23_HAELO|nr:hypothetical protein HPB48_027141 [Haemaphysalis longicornis]